VPLRISIIVLRASFGSRGNSSTEISASSASSAFSSPGSSSSTISRSSGSLTISRSSRTRRWVSM
jgi:hypothetical protein